MYDCESDGSYGMIIALDYDDTYTRDPQMWDLLIATAKARGHTVICVTMRYPQEGEQVLKALSGKVDDIIFTSRKAKYDYVTKTQGFVPSVWIDDSPWFIFNGAKA